MISTLPSIEQGNDARLNNITKGAPDIVFQEKIDGSQLTIFKKNGILHYYNKNKEINPKGKPWLNAYLSLNSQPHLFKEDYFYHGEAMTKNKTNVNPYERTPHFFWIVYEIVREDNYMLSPVEMNNLLQGTNIETVTTLLTLSPDVYSQGDFNLNTTISDIMTDVSKGTIVSSLGGKMEGVVMKTCKRMDNDKYKVTRYKYVRPEFSEIHRDKSKRLELKCKDMTDDEFIDNIGEMFNVPARKHKAKQHLVERGKWNENDPKKSVSNFVNELDDDLLKEQKEYIMNLLFIHYFPKISKIARGNVMDFITNLNQMK
jgi:RNA ligase